MAPLLLLFLFGGLCALFSLASSRTNKKCDDGGLCALFSVASSRTNKKCDDGGHGAEEAKNYGEQEEGAKMKQERKGQPDPEADLGIVFSTFDHDGDGFITARELEESLKRLGIAVSAAEVAAMVARVDANSDGLIDIHEFRELYDSIPKKRKQQFPASGDGGGEEDTGAEEAEQEEEEEERDLREAFDVFDGNKDGLISAEELGTVLSSLGLRRPGGRPAVAECGDMIRLVDSDGDGMVSFEEFKRMMTVVKT